MKTKWMFAIQRKQSGVGSLLCDGCSQGHSYNELTLYPPNLVLLQQCLHFCAGIMLFYARIDYALMVYFTVCKIVSQSMIQHPLLSSIGQLYCRRFIHKRKPLCFALNKLAIQCHDQVTLSYNCYKSPRPYTMNCMGTECK